MKKISKGTLGILAAMVAVGTMMTTAAFAGDGSAREAAWDRAFAAKPYVAAGYAPEEYKLARERGDMDKMWDAELLAANYTDVHYDSGTMLAAGAEAQRLNNAR